MSEKKSDKVKLSNDYSPEHIAAMVAVFFPKPSPFRQVKNSDGFFTFHENHDEIVGDAPTREASLESWHLAYKLYYNEPYE